MVDEEKTEKESEESEILDEELASNEEESDPAVYELGYLLLPTVAEESIEGEVTGLKKIVEKYKGVFVSDDMPKKRELAYTMEKGEAGKQERYNSAYFGWIKFEILPENILELKKEIEKLPNMLRFLLIRTVRESTLAPAKAFTFERVETPSRPIQAPRREEESKGPVSDEELDKSIEKLVAE